MTDRGEEALRQSADTLQVGPSAMHWQGDSLVVEINERAWPRLDRVHGEVRVTPAALTSLELPLTADESHIWRPFAPVARIEVALNVPGWQWSGHGYFDANFGVRALEADFSYWTWARLPHADGAVCLYDAERRDGSRLEAALRFQPNGDVERLSPPPVTPFESTAWRVRRCTRADVGSQPRQVRPMLDAPFYSRSVIETTIHGERSIGVHEALDLDRFAGPWLMPMLAFRVPRRVRWPSPQPAPR